MKTITVAELESLVRREDWRREQDYEFAELSVRRENRFDPGEGVPHTWGWASKISTLGGIKITYTETFAYDDYEPNSLVSGAEGLDEVWRMEGVRVVDEDGDEITIAELSDRLGPEFKEIDYNFLKIGQVTDIDVDEEDSSMKTYTLDVDNAPSIRFTGALIGSAESSPNNASGSSYSGATGRWTELKLYKTKGGLYVCHQIGRTQWNGERDRYSAKVCKDIEEVKAFFGHRWLAKELYEDAGIDDAVDVE